MNVVAIEPNVIRVTAYKTQTKELRIQVATQGRLPQGFRLDSTSSVPATVSVKVSESRASTITRIPTVPIDLEGKQSSFSQQMRLQLPVGVWPTPETPATVEVEIQISPTPNSESKSEK
jgi:YbbR domain-containing protein